MRGADHQRVDVIGTPGEYLSHPAQNAGTVMDINADGVLAVA